MRNENSLIEEINSYRKMGKLIVDLLQRDVFDEQRRMLVFVFKDGSTEGFPCHGDHRLDSYFRGRCRPPAHQ